MDFILIARVYGKFLDLFIKVKLFFDKYAHVCVFRSKNSNCFTAYYALRGI